MGLIRKLVVAFFFLAGCQGGKQSFEEPRRLGGIEVSAATLNRGEFVYMRYCRACHGQRGDGAGTRWDPQGGPPPRDFTRADFKYGSGGPGTLPTDADLERVITNGIAGTQMKAVAMSDDDRAAVIQFIKTLSPRWNE